MAPPLNSLKKLIFIFLLITVPAAGWPAFGGNFKLFQPQAGPPLAETVNCFAAPAKLIRVAIIRDTALVVISVNGYYKIVDSNNKVVSRGKYLSAAVACVKDQVTIAGVNYNSAKLLIKADDPESIVIGGRKYRGNIQFVGKDNSRMLVVNYIGLEDYIKGILYHEVSHYWPQEALKAQAIVCRTYAVYQKSQNASRDYDVTNDIYSQVYGGKSSERYRTNKAVDETAGQSLTYQNKIFPAYFHATCAGHTEDARLLWDIDIVPLRGVSCAYCKDSAHFSWHQALPLKQVKDSILKAGHKECGDIVNVLLNERDISGRITDIMIKTSKSDLKISAKDFRTILGANIIKSTNFRVKITGEDVIFEGFGWGHGVGMCQWGAYFMSKEGYDYKQIIQYYYPGAEIRNEAI